MSQKGHTLRNPQHDEGASGKSKWGSRIPELDGLRAIAIWMVLLLHVTSGYPKRPGALGFLPDPVLLVLGHGWLGVDLFFLLSGFLITGILLDTKNRLSYFKNFYVRRFLRIMPLYFTVVMVWVFAYHGYGRYFWLSSVFAANLAPLFHVPTPHGPGVLWSLAIEEHFYLLWPAVVLLLDRRKTLQVCATIFIVSPILRGIFAAKGMNPEVIYVLSWFRFDGLAMGAALAIWTRSEYYKKTTGYILAAILLVALCGISLGGARFGLFGTKTPLAVALRYTQAYLGFGACFILTLVNRGTKWTGLLRTRFMALSGALSYCLYLVHLSLGDLYQSVFMHQHFVRFGATAAVLVRGAFILSASFAVASLSRKYLERPALALKDRFTTTAAKKLTHVAPELAPGLETPS